MTLRTIGVRLTADISEYQSKLKAAGQTTRDFKGELSKAADKGGLDKVADVAGGVGLALAGMAGYALKSAADFDKAMSAVSAATHAPIDQIAALRAAALQAGKDTMYTAVEAAGGITELAKAGVSTANILGGGLTGALSLAAAGQLSVGDAAGIAASAMTQFKLSGSQIPHVADLLAAGAGKAQGSVQDIGMALNQSGLVASQFGLTIEDTTGALAEFAHAGLVGSDAGTSFRTMLLAIARPSTQTKALMDSLGISFYDAQGKFVGVSGVAQVLQTRLAGLTDQQRQSTLAQIFGTDAIRAASVLYTDGAKGVSQWKSAVNDSGYAAETAAKQTDNLAGDLQRLKGSLDTVAINAGSGGNSGLRVLTKGLNDVVNQLISLPSAVTSTATVLAGLGGLLLIGGAAWVKYRKFVTEAQAQLIATGPAGEKAAAGLSSVTSILGKAAAAFAVWQTAMTTADAVANKTPTNIDALTQGLEKFGSGANLSGEAARVLGSNLDNLKTGFAFLANTDNSRDQTMVRLQKGLESTIPGLKDYNTSLSNTQAQITSLDTALAQMVTAGHMQDAASAFQRLASQLAVNGVSMDEFKKQFPSYEAALETSQSATKGATGQLGDLSAALNQGADAQNQYKTEADAVAGAARGERTALGALYTQLKAETDPVFALIDAQQKMTTAQKDATKALHDHGAQSAEVKAADLNLAQAALGLQSAVGNLSTTFSGRLDPAFTATLRAAGLTDAQIKVVSGSFGDAKKAADRYTGSYPALVSAPGATTAKKQIDQAYTSAAGFAGPYVARLSVNGVGPVSTALDDLLVKQRALQTGLSVSAARSAVQKDLDRNRQSAYAEGGWTGPGSKYQPAGIVHADEFVIQAASRRKIESARPGLLDTMNRTGMPGYSGGGAVWPFRDDVSGTRIPTQAQMLSALGATAFGGSAATGTLGAWIMQGMALAGVPASWAGPLHTLIMRESGGNPRSINLTDSNAKMGDPSRGLMQTIGTTFEAHRLKSLPDDIYNPVANIVAGIRYILARYGSIFNVQQANANLPPKGYAAGGMITEPISGVGASGRRYTFGEAGPEYVTPAWQTGGSSGGNTYVSVQAGYVVSAQDLENKITHTIDRLRSKGRA